MPVQTINILVIIYFKKADGFYIQVLKEFRSAIQKDKYTNKPIVL